MSWIGALAYFVTRAAQTSFYSKFGLEPEDVGLGYAVALTRSGIALLLLTLVAAAIVAVFTLFRTREEHEHKRQESEPVRIRGIPWSAFEFLFVTLVLLALWMPLVYAHDAHSVKDAKSLRPAGLSTPQRLITNPLGLRVEPVRVSWTHPSNETYNFGNRLVMYLGRASGTAVFYDQEKNQTVRVPEGDIVIQRPS